MWVFPGARLLKFLPCPVIIVVDRAPPSTPMARNGDLTVTDWQPSPRYPDPLVHIVDQSFARYKLNLAKIERLFTGCRWCEGPVWFGDLRCLLWSDIPNNRVLRWDEETGTTTVFRKPSDFTNGNTRDRQGRLVSC